MKNKEKQFAVIGFLLATALLFFFGNQAKEKGDHNNFIVPILPKTVAYAETVDEIQADMNQLMVDIEGEMKDHPESTMMGYPGEFIKNSDSYKKITGLGLKAVKPIYDILYNSRDAGLYEYILAMAIQEITGEDFIYNTDYGWKNALEFRMAYEEKVNNVKVNVEKIINDSRLSDNEKAERLEEEASQQISSLRSAGNPFNINQNKEIYDSIVQLNGKAYK